MSRSLDNERLAVLVHEVRSPVAALSAIAESLAGAELDSGVRRDLVHLAILACRGVERVVTDAAVASIRLEPVDAVTLVEDVVNSAVLRGGRVELAASSVPIVRGDPSRLRQAVGNLVENAVVHGGTDGVVVVGVRADNALRISVTDTGPGVAQDQLERIFDVGVRLDPDATSGSGLGLAVARAIVDAHGGTLTVTSSAGVGTTFTVALPLGDA